MEHVRHFYTEVGILRSSLCKTWIILGIQKVVLTGIWIWNAAWKHPIEVHHTKCSQKTSILLVWIKVSDQNLKILPVLNEQWPSMRHLVNHLFLHQCNVMYGSAVCEWILGLSRGKVSHICGCRCTTIHNAHLWVLFSLGVSQNKEGYNATVFDKCNSLLQLFIPIITIP